MAHCPAHLPQLELGNYVVEYPLIVPPEGAFARRTLEEYLHRHNLGDRAHIVLETVLLDIIKKYVAAGVGIAFVHLAEEADPMPEIQVRWFDDSKKESIAAAAVVRKGRTGAS